ncbi:hypothetical protein SAMD00019534_041030 [Acytostelium subglobosum LB1]|uniref:hypothetical protein n=1 Tax=Acytostelium subglobosum LB1 TaxID=1410327 RepID=UPI000644D922|nr:hypothetical protein SAMD00019534_041030 [Acytostelium subglobosum LB1]GAM20928.1 hypothetical protein SAMD00019534_041030 [Acytostelium subglobosum LB1]|eukprot:XP_012756062.1 hypothetical protein SAMD00019534_041030 [Acytostelium subglobosum LB1]
MLANWKYPASIAILYLLVIHGLNLFMRNRKAMSLKGVSIVHNINLMTLSIVMMVGVLDAAYRQAQEEGVGSLFCERSPAAVNGRIGWWIYVFYLSKYYELFDTVLLSLKKKPIIFLAHLPPHGDGAGHVAVAERPVASLGRECWFKRYITSAQIVQFVTGSLIVTRWFIIRKSDQCQGGISPAIVSYIVNNFFILLFVRFYIKSYSSGGSNNTRPSSNKLKESSTSSSSASTGMIPDQTTSNIHTKSD